MGALADLVLLSPAGLLALTALAVPILIHIINRSRGKRVLVGNIGLLRNLRQQKVREIRLERWLLLLVRMLLLALAAFLLARLALPGLDDLHGDVTYVTPDWLDTASTGDRERLLDGSDGTNPGGARLLAPGYPRVDEATELVIDDVWPVLAERLATVRHTGRVEVYTQGRSDAFGAWRPRLPGDVRWHAGGRAAVPVEPPAPRVLLLFDPGREEERALVETALASIQRHRLPGLTWHSRAAAAPGPDAAEFDVLLRWSASSPAAIGLPADHRGRIVDLDAPDWSTPPGDAGFPAALLDRLLTRGDRSRAWGHARVDPSAWPAGSTDPDGAEEARRPYRALTTWLALAMILLWALERWLSERRHGR